MFSNDKVTEKEFTHQGTDMDGMPFVESSLLRQLKEATRVTAVVWKEKPARKFK